MNNYVYPLGSIVAINDGIEVFIVSYGNKKIGSEYLGTVLLEDYDINKIYPFNNENILYPIFIGYENEEINKIRENVGKDFPKPKIPYLPIGSVVSTEKVERLLIIGFADYNEKKDELHDFIGINYDNEEEVLFNRDDVTDILFVGMQTKESIGLSIMLKEINSGPKNGKFLEDKMKEILNGIEVGGN